MKYRNLLAAALLAALPALTPAQEADNIISWQWTALPAGSAADRVYELHFTGSIAAGYIVYGPDFQVDFGPRPTRTPWSFFTFPWASPSNLVVAIAHSRTPPSSCELSTRN